MSGSAFIGRQSERARLDSALAEATGGQGSLLLLSGEAGIGKTRLAEEALVAAPRFLRGAAAPAAAPYGPVTSALREFLRAEPEGLSGCGPLRSHLALLLPELGTPEATDDRATLVEAIRCGLAAMVADRPAGVLLDDLQWSDEATLELLAALGPGLRELPLLIVATYRSDELSRNHPLRRLRNDLRRSRALDELEIGPLDGLETALLVEDVAGAPPSPQLVRALHDRTGGVPFFVEELTTALEAGGRLERGPDGLGLEVDADVPLPQTVRDAVLVQTAAMSDAARAAAEAAAVAGTRFDIGLLDAFGVDEGLAELAGGGVVVEVAPGRAEWRHPLTRDAIYEDVPWLRRRKLHRRLAEELTSSGGDNGEIAGHWIAARDPVKARVALLDAIAERAAIHAYRDATALGRQALEHWPEGERGAERIEVLESHARYAELAGDLSEAARAQREVVTARRAEGAGRALADAERRMAMIYALQGDRERALVARRVAAEAYAANGLPGDAAAERLVMAGYLQSAGQHADAVEAASTAHAEAARAERYDLQARALGLEGVARVKGGAFEEGIEIVRSGLSLALDRELTTEAAEVYQRLGTAHEIAGDYAGARDALGTALGLCEATGQDGLEQVCLGCLAYVLRELGDWNEVADLCERLIVPDASAGDTLVADGVLGTVRLWRGQPDAARPLLERCLDTAAGINVVSMQCDSIAALAWLSAEAGDHGRAEELCAMLLARWEGSEDHHYAVWGLRWAAGWLAQSGSLPQARECAEALSRLATSAGHPDAIAALAYALAEIALADGDPESAGQQFSRAVELHSTLEIPFERAQILLRSGVTMAALGERDVALEQLSESYRVATDLGAAPLAGAAAAAVADLGESVGEHLGRRAEDTIERGGLSRRELEVVRLVAEGLTNKEIAASLVLSTRTVDMHVRHILVKLRCRTRTEAATRAGELGLLATEV